MELFADATFEVIWNFDLVFKLNNNYDWSIKNIIIYFTGIPIYDILTTDHEIDSLELSSQTFVNEHLCRLRDCVSKTSTNHFL